MRGAGPLSPTRAAQVDARNAERAARGVHVERAEFSELLDMAAKWTRADLGKSAWAMAGQNGFSDLSLAQVLDSLTHGSPADAALLNARVLTVTQSLPTTLAPASTDDWLTGEEGIVPDVARYVEGEPECWLRPAESQPRRVVSLVVEQIVPGVMAQSEVYERGTWILAAITALERRGIGINLDCVFSGYFPEGHCLQMVTVKRADQPMDVDRLAFILGSASWSRTLGWCWSGSRGYHHGCGIKRTADEYKELDLSPDSVVLTSGFGGAEVVDYIAEQLAERGIL